MIRSPTNKWVTVQFSDLTWNFSQALWNYQRGMTNLIGSYPQWRGNPYIDLLAEGSGQGHRLLTYGGPNESQDKGFSLYQATTAFSEGGWASRVQLVVLRMENYPFRWMNHKVANSLNIWKENGEITTLLFSLKGLEILHQETRG